MIFESFITGGAAEWIIRPKRLPAAACGGGLTIIAATAGIYFPLYIVLHAAPRSFAIYYLTADLQLPKMFKPRKPLSAAARRAGWQGYFVDLQQLPQGAIVRLI